MSDSIHPHFKIENIGKIPNKSFLFFYFLKLKSITANILGKIQLKILFFIFFFFFKKIAKYI